ncbi:MAG: hypothetical protein AABY46_05305 [Nitrospirota bacterium]
MKANTVFRKGWMAVVGIVAVGLMAGSAFAGVLSTTAKTVAAELVGSADVAVPTTVAPLSFRTEVDITAGATFTITLTGGKFTGAAARQLAICSGTTDLATSAVFAADSATALLTVLAGQSLAGASIYAIQFGADTGDVDILVCNEVGGAAPSASLPVKVNGNAVAGATITTAVTASSVAGVTSAVVTMYTLSNQFSAVLSPVISTIDFTSTSLRNFKADPATAPPDTTATQSQAGLLILSVETLDNKVTSGAADTTCASSGLAANDTLNVVVSGTFTEALKTTAGLVVRDLVNGADVAASAAITTSTTSATVPMPGNTLKICGSNSTAATRVGNVEYVQITVDGTTSLVPRTFTASVTFVGTGTNIKQARTLVASGTLSHTYKLDATQLYVPLVKSDAATGTETYIKLQSKSTVSGSNAVKVAILASDGTTSANFNAGSIVAGTPLTITGTQLVAAATAAGKTVSGTSGFAVIITVDSPEADLFAFANIVDAIGPKRVPVKTVNAHNGGISE